MQEKLKRLGQLFIIGFEGAQPPSDFLNFIGEEQIGDTLRQ